MGSPPRNRGRSVACQGFVYSQRTRRSDSEGKTIRSRLLTSSRNRNPISLAIGKGWIVTAVNWRYMRTSSKDARDTKSLRCTSTTLARTTPTRTSASTETPTRSIKPWNRLMESLRASKTKTLKLPPVLKNYVPTVI